MENPNKLVRKAIFEALKSTYTCFDTQVTSDNKLTSYVIISTQNKELDKANKCNNRLVSYTLLDIVNIYNGAGNTGSRLANDDMEQIIMNLIENIQIEGFKVLFRNYEFPPNINTNTPTQAVYRSFIRVILTLE